MEYLTYFIVFVMVGILCMSVTLLASYLIKGGK